jgi:Poly(R)-hydroxyalkanoic acid synthase subunit (PHA_synth_III_E)
MNLWPMGANWQGAPDFCAAIERDLRGLARVAEALSRPARNDRPDPDDLQARLAAGYRDLFMPAAGEALMNSAASAAPLLRYQAALQRSGAIALAIARDAGARLLAALSETGPQAPPITSLRALHELWIECGEAAYAAAAHREDFAEAQAELLAALVELQSRARSG